MTKLKLRGSNKSRSGLNKMAAARKELLLEEVETESVLKEEFISTGAKDCIPDDLPLSIVSPDPENARDFTVVKPAGEEMHNSIETNKGQPYVIIDKGILINKTPTSHPLYAHMQKQVDDIENLATQIKSGGGVYQTIEVYRRGGTDYSIVYGHRRFYAVVFLKGWEGVWSFKVHRETPKNPKVRQFVENSSRSDLRFHEKLKAFRMAVDDIQTNSTESINTNEMIATLGITRSTFFKLQRFLKYPFIYDAARDGVDIVTIDKLLEIFKNLPKSEEASLPTADILKNEIAKIFLAASKTVPQYLVIDCDVEVAQCKNEEKASKVTSTRGPRVKLYKAPNITSSLAVKTLLTSDVTKMNIDGIDWDEVNWDDRLQVNKCLSATIKALEKLKD